MKSKRTLYIIKSDSVIHIIVKNINIHSVFVLLLRSETPKCFKKYVVWCKNEVYLLYNKAHDIVSLQENSNLPLMNAGRVLLHLI